MGGSAGGKVRKGLDPLGIFRDNIAEDNMGRPSDPDYFGADGTLQEKYKLSNGADFTKLAQDRLATDTAAARDKAAMSGAGATAQARNSLASRGGLSGGTAAILARQAMADQSGAQQDITNTGVRGNQDIGMKQFDIGREAEKYNLTNTLGLKQSVYDAKMQEYGASKTADAQARVQNNKGILGK